jgi:hypothetical protein
MMGFSHHLKVGRLEDGAPKGGSPFMGGSPYSSPYSLL